MLGTPISRALAAAIVRAHHVGDGELGRDGVRLASLGNYTPRHLAIRTRILRASGLSPAQTRRLMEAGIVGQDREGARSAAHRAITTDLFHGRVYESARFSANGNLTQVLRVRIRNPRTGRSRLALFKPRQWGDNDGFGRTPMEYVTYELNRMLGMDYVPPAAYRHDIDVHFRRYAEGALLQFVPEARVLAEVPEEQWGVRRDLFLSDARVLDVLLQNSDRHPGNYMFGRHWANGQMMPILIDHSASLRPNRYVTMTDDDAFGGGPVQVVRRATLDGLRRLSHDGLRRTFGDFVTADEIRGILIRRDSIVHYFKQLIARRGESNVVVDHDF